MTRRRLILWLAIGIPLAIIIAAGSVAFVILRTLESTPATAESAAATFDEVRRLFAQRPPLVELTDLRSGSVRINRAPASPRKMVETVHFMIWDPEDQKLTRGNAPLWIMNLRVSITGIGNLSFSDLHITREDVERYAPGIVFDLKAPDGNQVLVWAPAPPAAR